MGIGGKGGAEAPPEADYTDMNSTLAQMMMMSQQMSAAQQSMAAMPTQPEQTAMPEIVETKQIDWTEKQKQLASKMKADYGADKAARKGRLDTIHTSPLLDDDEAETTKQGLIGG